MAGDRAHCEIDDTCKELVAVDQEQAIDCYHAQPCTGDHGSASRAAPAYFELVAQTEGTGFSICESDWSALFAGLRDSVVTSARLPCSFALPDPPPGLVFNPSRINLIFENESGDTVTIPRAPNEAGCSGALGPERAWYYDNPSSPTRIDLCPATCDIVRDAPGSMELQLGCDTIVI